MCCCRITNDGIYAYRVKNAHDHRHSYCRPTIVFSTTTTICLQRKWDNYIDTYSMRTKIIKSCVLSQSQNNLQTFVVVQAELSKMVTM